MQYHRSSQILSVPHLKAVIRTAWRAESYVDQRAAKLMAELFPDLRYDWTYKTAAHHRDFHADVISGYRTLLSRWQN